MEERTATTIVGETAVVIAGLPHRVENMERDIDRLELAVEGIRTLIEGIRDDFRQNYVTMKYYDTEHSKVVAKLEAFDQLYKDALVSRAKNLEDQVQAGTNKVAVISAITGIMYLAATVVLHFIR